MKPTDPIVRTPLVLAAALAIWAVAGSLIGGEFLPLVWIATGLALAATLLVRPMAATRVGLAVTSVLFSVALVETTLALWPGGGGNDADEPGAYFGHSYAGYYRTPDVLGYRPAPSQTVHASKLYTTGELIYDVDYTIGPTQLRVTPSGETRADEGTGRRERQSTVLFFGGSFVYGEGVEDDETLPFFFSKATGHRHRVLNFGLHGYGTHQMLRALELSLPDADVEGKVKAAYYVFISHHLSRNAGETTWGHWDPEYRLDATGRAVFRGHFVEHGNWLHEAVYTSHISRATFGLRELPRDDRIALWVGILEASREILRARYGTDLVVVIWNYRPGDSANLVSALESAGFTPRLVSSLLEDPTAPENQIRGDGHPSPLAHRRVGYALAAEGDARAATGDGGAEAP